MEQPFPPSHVRPQHSSPFPHRALLGLLSAALLVVGACADDRGAPSATEDRDEIVRPAAVVSTRYALRRLHGFVCLDDCARINR